MTTSTNVKLRFRQPMPRSSYSGTLVFLDDPIPEYRNVIEPFYPAAIDREGNIEYMMIQDDGWWLNRYVYKVSTYDRSVVYQDAGGRVELIKKLQELRQRALEEVDKTNAERFRA